MHRLFHTTTLSRDPFPVNVRPPSGLEEVYKRKRYLRLQEHKGFCTQGEEGIGERKEERKGHEEEQTTPVTNTEPPISLTSSFRETISD